MMNEGQTKYLFALLKFSKHFLLEQDYQRLFSRFTNAPPESLDKGEAAINRAIKKYKREY